MSPEPDDDERLRALVRRALGAEIERRDPLPPGLGTRRFVRLWLRGADGVPERLIARIEAPEDPARRPAGVAPEPPLEPIRALLERRGIPVPRSFGRDAEAGIDLLEDVGDESLERAAGHVDPIERRALYREAGDLVVALQSIERPPDAPAAFERRLDAALVEYKAQRLIDWGLPGTLGRPATDAEAAVVRESFARIADAVREAPARLAHRDFKAANVHIRAGAPPGRRLVLIDLQGAFLAPPEYDLVCLLHDSQVALPLVEIDAQLAALRPRLPDAPDPESLARRFHLMTLSRVGKDLALYLYAAHALGDRRYLPWVPRALAILQRSAARAARREPAFGDFADLVQRMGGSRCAP